MNILKDTIGEDDKRSVRDSQDMILAFQVSFFAMCRLSTFPWSVSNYNNIL